MLALMLGSESYFYSSVVSASMIHARILYFSSLKVVMFEKEIYIRCSKYNGEKKSARINNGQSKYRVLFQDHHTFQWYCTLRRLRHTPPPPCCLVYCAWNQCRISKWHLSYCCQANLLLASCVGFPKYSVTASREPKRVFHLF